MSAYATGTIAGVSLVGPASAALKAQVLDGASFFSDYTGSFTEAADGTVDTQLVNVGSAGAHFGVLFDGLTLACFALIKAAIAAALAGGDSFPVVLADDFHSISVNCHLDYSQGNPVSYPNQRLNATYVKDVTFRFRVVE